MKCNVETTNILITDDNKTFYEGDGIIITDTIGNRITGAKIVKIENDRLIIKMNICNKLQEFFIRYDDIMENGCEHEKE